jgi:hypothetical protein
MKIDETSFLLHIAFPAWMTSKTLQEKALARHSCCDNLKACKLVDTQMVR